MQPTTPTPTPNPAPPVLEPVIDLICTQRQNVGSVLLGAAVVFLALTGWLGLKTSRISAPAPDAIKGAKDKDRDSALKALPTDGGDVTQPDRIDYIIGAVDAFAVAVALAAMGGFLLAAPPKLKVEEQRTQARLAVLVLGSAVGAILTAAGALYFYQWNGSLVKWLEQGELSEARWVVIPLLVVVAGGALMFVSAQPARAEERNNASVRQFIYGSNFGLTILMVFVVLVIVNAVIALRVPNKLDTTSTAFYTLNSQTKQLIEGLDQPLRAYAIFQDGGDPVTEDAKRLLASCQDVNPGKFRVTYLSPALNKDAISKLRSEYPLAEMSGEGVLLVVGEDGADRKRHSFIRGDEFEESKSESDGRQVPAFNGEPKLLRELMFLAESKQKPKIYFTQSSGELSLTGGRDPRRSATALKTYLEKNYFDVQPLTFDLGGPAKVPDDAAVVVVADPTVTLPPNGVEALRKFMTEPRPNDKDKKGKLVVLAGMQPGPDGKPLVLGIEPVLQPFGVRLSDRFMYGEPKGPLADLDRAGGIRVTLARVTQEGAEARNPVALGFKALSGLPLLDCRELVSAQGGGAQLVPVLVSEPGRLTWTETQYARSPIDAWGDLNDRVGKIVDGPGTREEKQRARVEIQEQMQMSKSPRELALFASEGETARVAVFGCGWFVSDDASTRASRMSRGQVATLWLDLMGSTLDWVRDRPQVRGIEQKPYTTYTLKPGYDTLRMLWLPLGLALLCVTGFGAGVWVIRRK